MNMLLCCRALEGLADDIHHKHDYKRDDEGVIWK